MHMQNTSESSSALLVLSDLLLLRYRLLPCCMYIALPWVIARLHLDGWRGCAVRHTSAFVSTLSYVRYAWLLVWMGSRRLVRQPMVLSCIGSIMRHIGYLLVAWTLLLRLCPLPVGVYIQSNSRVGSEIQVLAGVWCMHVCT
ncbi:hypothetical protein N656DRAFT_643683 [Canariomyces notabilis]|uniref:Uncharacterized protein n=1 Tax=Canariomyces notabilis TaxID=2074819 RepID=A0AAN6TFX4_9PEZI|nr:hypothetical protein N656DRAFT_643683 [Canariomyces arenarius]